MWNASTHELNIQKDLNITSKSTTPPESVIKIINKWVESLVTGQKQPVYGHQDNPQTCGVLYGVTRLENHRDTATYSVILVHGFEK